MHWIWKVVITWGMMIVAFLAVWMNVWKTNAPKEEMRRQNELKIIQMPKEPEVRPVDFDE